jgi:hypothetical protein
MNISYLNTYMLQFDDFNGYAAVFFIQVGVHFLGRSLCIESQDGGAGVHVVPRLRCL